MKRSESGFTLVELMMVIAVIAILARIILTVYSGATQRARDAQTVTAVNQWTKAIQTYTVRTGGYLTMASCLGVGYKYGVTEAAGSGFQCRQYDAATGITSSAAFATAMQPYLSNQPTPAMQTASNTATDWYRGAYFNPTGGADRKSVRIDFVLSDRANCPDKMGGYPVVYAATTTNKFKICCVEIGRQP